MSPGLYHFSPSKPPLRATAHKPLKEVKPSKMDINQRFKEAQIGLTGERVINYFNKT